jgi:phosphonatase-like hydrolase
MGHIRLAVLDMAGTTVRDNGEVPRAFALALAEAGVEATPAQIDAVRGSSKREAVRRFIPVGPDRDRAASSAYASFQRHLSTLYQRGVEPADGAARTFAWLRARGIRVVLNTGFDRDITSLLLTALQWNDEVVDAVVCGEDVARGRPAPDLILRAMELTRVTDPGCVLNAGDTILDLAAGHSAGVRWNVGVLSGAHDRSALERAPHTCIIESIADLPSLPAFDARGAIGMP